MTKLLLAALTASIAVGASAAQAAPRHAQDNTPCFFINQWQGWKAPDDHTLYLGVNYHEVYKVGLAGGSPILQDPDARIVSITHGPDSVCYPLDLQLSVVEPYGIREPLIAKSLVKLTPDEVKAIPPKYRPY
jgi:hypothetical protein